MINNVSFKATFVDNVNIKTLNNRRNYVDKQVSFVKRNPYSRSDYNSIVDIGNLWGDVDPNYVMSMLHHSDIIKDNEKRDIYFLTEQEENFRKIIPEKVLGMIEITKHKEYNKIYFIQTRPDIAYYTAPGRKRKNKDIGLAMLTMAEKLSNGKDIILNAVKAAVEFYKKYGFEVTYNKCINPKMVLHRAKIHK